MDKITEESTGWLTITFQDKTGTNQAPVSAEYRIDSSLGEEIRSWTEISDPQAEHELTLVPEDNRIVDPVDDLEENSLGGWQTNIVTVKAIFGNNDERNETYKYKILDLGKIPKST